MNRKIKDRFDGYLPVVIDLETSGCVAATDALLELAAITLKYNEEGCLVPDVTFACQIEPFAGAHFDPKALEITGINPYQPFRLALSEEWALHQFFNFIRNYLHFYNCKRAMLVGHNAHFDLGFIQEASLRCNLKKYNPFHSFTCIDTASLSSVYYGVTVLARATKAAGIFFDQAKAHSAVYDADCTAKLFCKIVNQFDFKKY